MAHDEKDWLRLMKEMRAENKGTMHQLIEKYFDYFMHQYEIPPGQFMGLSLYGQLLEVMLKDHGLEPKTLQELDGAITKLFKGKRVLDVGCRYGLFLSFLRAHGAIIAGTTSEKYYAVAREFLGKKAVLVEGNSEEIGGSPLLQRFKPDYLFSSNLFDSYRHPFDNPPLGKLMRSLYRVVAPKTTVYMVPSFDSHGVITPEQVIRGRRIRDFNSFLLLSREQDRFNLSVMGTPNFAMRFKVRKKERVKPKQRKR